MTKTFKQVRKGSVIYKVCGRMDINVFKPKSIATGEFWTADEIRKQKPCIKELKVERVERGSDGSKILHFDDDTSEIIFDFQFDNSVSMSYYTTREEAEAQLDVIKIFLRSSFERQANIYQQMWALLDALKDITHEW